MVPVHDTTNKYTEALRYGCLNMSPLGADEAYLQYCAYAIATKVCRFVDFAVQSLIPDWLVALVIKDEHQQTR